MKATKLIPLSRIAAKGTDTPLDSVRAYGTDTRLRGMTVLMEAQNHYNNLSRFRRDRERCKRYCYGDQWKDIVTVDGQQMTEEQYIKNQGSVPLKNNLIRRLVKAVLGVYRSQMKEPACVARDRDEQKQGETMSTILQYNWQLNRMNEVQTRSMEEFLISGFVVHRKWYGWNTSRNKLDCWTEYVQPNNFFIDSNMRDFRGWDASCMGELHDVSFGELCSQFAHSAADYTRLAQIYNATHSARFLVANCHEFGYRYDHRDQSFLYCADSSRCRVIEVWRKETKPRYRCIDTLTAEVFKCDTEDLDTLVLAVNRERKAQAEAVGMADAEVPYITYEWFIDNYWYYYFLTPFGDILEEGETPYAHRETPYVFKAYPFIDGEIHSFVADIIDQQRYTNRLITLYDWIMRASAKGVLLFPEEALTDEMNLSDVAEEWARFNGVIAIKTKDGVPLPRQLASNSTNIGISELLNIQLKFFEEISGVQGALQGKAGFSGQSAALYQQQTQNASTMLLDVLDTFSSFTIDAAYKDVKNIQQFYDDRRIINIAGRNAVIVTDPDKIRDTEFDLSVVESTASPAYRQLANDFLMRIWEAGQINLEQLLTFGDFQFADELLQNIKAQREQLQQGQQPGALPQQLQQQVQQGADMEAVDKAYAAIAS